ncbi:UNVERIFIED_CONTAM: hypothetical protein K2H54_068638 [Gekko kuhli]
MAQQQVSSSQKALMLELKGLQEEPVEGFRITLVDESDLYNWEVAIFGPPNTLYEGGYFKLSEVSQATQVYPESFLPEWGLSLVQRSNIDTRLADAENLLRRCLQAFRFVWEPGGVIVTEIPLFPLMPRPVLVLAGISLGHNNRYTFGLPGFGGPPPGKLNPVIVMVSSGKPDQSQLLPFSCAFFQVEVERPRRA